MKVPPSMRSMPEGQPPELAAGSTGGGVDGAVVADGAAVTAGSGGADELTAGGSGLLCTDDVGCGSAGWSGAPGGVTGVGPHAAPHASKSATASALATPSRGHSPSPRLLISGRLT